MQLTPFSSVVQAQQPVTWFAWATHAPEHVRGLAGSHEPPGDYLVTLNRWSDGD